MNDEHEEIERILVNKYNELSALERIYAELQRLRIENAKLKERVEFWENLERERDPNLVFKAVLAGMDMAERTAKRGL